MGAAIYCRISHDIPGDSAGVQRQEKDCRALAKTKGWPVGEVFVDNDVSAYSGKRRPEYRRMLAAIKANEVDAVIVWHLDRLTRRPIELEEFFDVCVAAGLKKLATVTGDVDLSTHDGRFMARILGAAARKESDDKSRRTRRKHEELAEQGRPVGSGRPFGYEADKVTVRPAEAELVREAAARVLAGETLYSIARHWQDRGITTSRGRPWVPQKLRELLLSARIAGKRTLGKNGPVVAEAIWPTIVDDLTWQRLRAVLSEPGRRVNWGVQPRRYLLTGWLYCGKCGMRMIAQPRNDRRRSYTCSSSPSVNGCGGVRIVAEPLEALITERVFDRIRSGLPDALVRQRGAAINDQDVIDAIAADEARRDELAAMFAIGELGKTEWLAARSAIEERIDAGRGRLVRIVTDEAAAELAGADVETTWEDRSLHQKRAVIGTLIERIVIGPGRPGSNRFDPLRATEIVWRI